LGRPSAGTRSPAGRPVQRKDRRKTGWNDSRRRATNEQVQVRAGRLAKNRYDPDPKATGHGLGALIAGTHARAWRSDQDSRDVDDSVETHVHGGRRTLTGAFRAWRPVSAGLDGTRPLLGSRRDPRQVVGEERPLHQNRKIAKLKLLHGARLFWRKCVERLDGADSSVGRRAQRYRERPRSQRDGRACPWQRAMGYEDQKKKKR